MDALKRENLENTLEVYIDGGIRRGSDIFKALALGAKGVGIGRPTLVRFHWLFVPYYFPYIHK